MSHTALLLLFLAVLLAACGDEPAPDPSEVPPEPPAARAWPNDAGWRARADGVVVATEEGETVHLSVVACGTLDLPSGRLVIADPFAALQHTGNAYVDVPPGSYPVEVTLADVSGKDDGSHIREAYVSVLLSSEPEVVRRPLTPSPRGTVDRELGHEEYVGFGVDSGSGCLVDAASLATAMPPEDEWSQVFDDGTERSWFALMDAVGNPHAGLANVVLPLAKNEENIVLFQTGWGDGYYAIVGGFDAAGRLVAVHVDLFLL